MKKYKYRVSTWHDIYEEGAPIKFYGIEIKRAGTARYRHCVSDGKLMQFDTRAEALHKISELEKK